MPYRTIRYAEWIPDPTPLGKLWRRDPRCGDRSLCASVGSIQVSGIASLPWVRSRVWVGAGLGLALREGWVDTSHNPGLITSVWWVWLRAECNSPSLKPWPNGAPNSSQIELSCKTKTFIGGWSNGTAKLSHLVRKSHSIVWLRPRSHLTVAKQLGKSSLEFAKRWKMWLELGEKLSCNGSN